MGEITLDARKNAIAAARAVAEENVRSGTGVANRLRFQGQDLTLPVVRVALEYVLLNPNSHRIGSEVKSLGPEEAQLLKNDPFGEAAQSLIARLLSETKDFAGLRTMLEREKQREAGVITEAGILINANTRAAALRELGEKYIDVMVLPGNAGEKEFNDIELRLQMSRDGKQDYSFISQLLFIEDLLNAGWGAEEIGRELRPDLADTPAGRKKALEDVELELRLLALVRDVVALGGGRMTFTRLDGRRQALIEIDSDYQQMKNKDPDTAERVKYAQLTAMVADVDYRKIRHIDDSLISTYVLPAMEEDDTFHGRLDSLLGDGADGDEEPGGLEGWDLLDDDTTDGVSFRGLLALVASAEEDGSVDLPAQDDAPAVTVTTKALRGALFRAFDLAIATKNQDTASGDALTAPTRALESAARAIDNARVAYDDVRRDASFDTDAFERAQQRLQRAYDSLLDALDEQLPDATA